MSPLMNTPERRAQKQRDKANARCTRAKQARFDDELSTLVFKEAHSLRKLRNKATEIEWHVDHIIPLKGKEVSGLHIWSNIQVIPKVINLKKGNKIALHDWWKTRLQERGSEVYEQAESEEEEGYAECSETTDDQGREGT